MNTTIQPPSRKEANKRYRERNKEKIRAQEKLWRERRDKLEKNLYQKQYHTKRMKADPLYASKRKLRRAVSSAFERIKANKSADTLTLLGCSWEEAKEHFENLFEEGMSWDNHGKWHIDHIRPVSDWKEGELHLMNHITNLQPLWAAVNISKSDFYH